MKTTFLAVCLALAAGLLRAAAVSGARPVEEIDWKASGSLPPGAEYHLVHENPVTKGVQTLVRFPSGYTLPEHAHSNDESLVVLKGKMIVEQGGAQTTLGPGGYAVFPAGQPHKLTAKGWGGCEALVTMDGPFDIKGLPDHKTSAGQ